MSLENTLNGYYHALNPFLPRLVECDLTACNFCLYLCIIEAEKGLTKENPSF